MEKKYRLVTETGRILLGGETYNHNAAERWFDDFNGIWMKKPDQKKEYILRRYRTWKNITSLTTIILVFALSKKSTETAKSYLPDQSRIVIENALN